MVQNMLVQEPIYSEQYVSHGGRAWIQVSISYHCVLSSCIFAVLDHLYSVVDVLCCCASDDGTVIVSGIIECFPLALNQSMSFAVPDKDGLAGAS